MSSLETAPPTVAAAQRDVRDVYRHGWVGQAVSAGVWALAGGVWLAVSPTAGVLTLFVLGTLILPLTMVGLWLAGGPVSLPRGHPLARLAMQLAFTVPIGLLVAVAAADGRAERFFPAALLVVGAHYLPFGFLYGSRVFPVLGSTMVAAGIGLATLVDVPAATGAFVGASLLAAASVALRVEEGLSDSRDSGRGR